MATQNNVDGFVQLTTSDLSGPDPGFGRLNNQLQRLWAKINGLTSSSGSSSGSSFTAAWGIYTPTPTINGFGMTLSGFANFLAQSQSDNSKMFVNLDIQCTIAGTLGSKLLVSLPSTPPAQNSFGNVMSCMLYPGSSTPVAGMARVDTIGSTAGIAVYRADGANFAAGALEIVISGWYQI